MKLTPEQLGNPIHDWKWTLRDADREKVNDMLDTIADLTQRLEASEGRVQRLWDLCRYKRSELLTDELINADEYTELAKDHPAVARLEGYDGMRIRAEEAERQLTALTQRLEASEAAHKVELALLRGRLHTIGMAGEFGPTNSEVVARLRELEYTSEQARQYVQHAKEREGKLAEAERQLAELRERPHPEHDTCPCCVNNGRWEMREPMACGHPKACLSDMKDVDYYETTPGGQKKHVFGEAHCTACEREKAQVAAAYEGIKN